VDKTNSANTEHTMSAHREGHRPVLGQIRPSGRMVRQVLLALGIVGPLFYVATDIFAATRWEGYSYTDQTVSELFAIGAPTRPLVVPLMLTYGVLAIAFGLGVWTSAGEKRALRVVAVGLIAKEVLGSVATLFAPIHLRESAGSGRGNGYRCLARDSHFCDGSQGLFEDVVHKTPFYPSCTTFNAPPSCSSCSHYGANRRGSDPAREL
jgi:hypothetical protein